jgi:hypothetical protein
VDSVVWAVHEAAQDPDIERIVSPLTLDGRPNGSVFIGTSSEEMTGTTYHVHSAFWPTIERVKLVRIPRLATRAALFLFRY